MATTTTFDVLLRYRLDNKATEDAKHLREHLDHAGHSASGLGHILGHLGMIAGGVMSIHGAWEHLVKFNSEVENAKISLAAMVEGGFGGSFDYAKAQAESLYKEFQKFSTQTPMTTQEMLEFSRGVAVSTQQAGGSIQDIVTITEQGAVAAKALGMESHYAARELSEMLSGNINNRMLFAKQLAGLGGKSTEDLRKMSGGERLAFIKQTLNSPAMKDAVASMSSSFSGVTSTLVDKLQILMGKVGLPLFKAITAEVSRWNEWIDKNDDKIKKFANTVGGELVNAFGVVKDVFSFIYDHSDTFLAIGKVWAAVKIGNMLGGSLLGGGGGGLMGLLGNLGTSTSKLGTGSVLGPAMLAGLGGYELGKLMGLEKVGTALSEWAFTLNPMSYAQLQLAKRTEDLERATGEIDEAFKNAKESIYGHNATLMQANIDLRNQQIALLSRGEVGAGLTKEEVSQGGGTLATMMQVAMTNGMNQAVFNQAGFKSNDYLQDAKYTQLTEYQRQTLIEAKAQTELFAYFQMHLSKGIPVKQEDLLDILRRNTADPEGKHKAIVEKPNVNVTIHRIEVQSEDPDRFAFRFVEAFRDATKNPSQALHTLREG